MQSYQRFQCIGHTVFNTSGTNGHVRFHGRKWVHTRLSEKNRTQGLTRRNRGVSDGGGITTLGLFHTFRKPCVARGQNGVLCRFWVLAGGAPEERRKPAGQRCAYARRCSEASRPRWAACSFSLLPKLRFVHPALRAFRMYGAGVVSLPAVRFTCCRNTGRPLVKRANLPFSEVR